MWTLFRRIGHDLRHLRNIDAYAAALLVFVFAYVFPKIGQGIGGARGAEDFSTLLVAGIALGAKAVGGSHKTAQAKPPAPGPPLRQRKAAVPRHLPPPDHVRGVHVTMALASLPGKLQQYLAIPGLNTIELDVKDENGQVGFTSGVPPLARQDGAAGAYYDPASVAGETHKAGIYLIGRVVTFEDPITATAHPDMAVMRTDGTLWHTSGGLAWLNPYSRAAWRYDVDVAVAAAKAGFDEIQFDYVRFPSDGDVSIIRYPGAHTQPMGETVAAFLRYAKSRLHPLGVRVSADVFGLAATHDLGIGQYPAQLAKVVDAIYPMTYPSHYRPGEYNLPDPNAAPAKTVAYSLRDFRARLAGTDVRLVPWLQDFSLGRTYTAADVGAEIAAARRFQTSGFMLWQGAYSELVFVDVFWPAFRFIDLLRAVRTYQKRRRRHGK